MNQSVRLNDQVQQPIKDFFGPAQSTYTRENALSDGVLVDVSDIAIDAGIRIPIAITSEAWSHYVQWTSDDADKQDRTYQNETGRLWNIFKVLKFALMGKSTRSPAFLFEIACVARDGQSYLAEAMDVKCILGQDENGKACITLMMPGQD